MAEILHKELSYAVHGVLLRVHNELGPMLSESFYRDASQLGLKAANIRCECEKQFTVLFRGLQVGTYYVDVWVEDGKILLELKSTSKILPLHKGQAISYLKVTNADLAIVVNFGAASLTTERLPNYLRDKKVTFAWKPSVVPDDMIHPELTMQIFMTLHQVHFELGPGFLHQIYRRATMIALQQEGIGFTYIEELPVYYQGRHLGNQQTHLLCVEDKILVAPIAVSEITEAMRSKLKAILKQQKLKLGLIANFNGTTLAIAPIR